MWNLVFNKQNNEEINNTYNMSTKTEDDNLVIT